MCVAPVAKMSVCRRLAVSYAVLSDGGEVPAYLLGLELGRGDELQRGIGPRLARTGSRRSHEQR